jgi:hypothetical protein
MIAADFRLQRFSSALTSINLCGCPVTDQHVLPLLESVQVSGPLRLLSRGGCQKRWHSRVNCDHGDATPSRFASLWAAVLTEVYLCASCSCHQILRGATARLRTPRRGGLSP